MNTAIVGTAIIDTAIVPLAIINDIAIVDRLYTLWYNTATIKGYMYRYTTQTTYGAKGDFHE
jgi:hypothetical protein